MAPTDQTVDSSAEVPEPASPVRKRAARKEPAAAVAPDAVMVEFLRAHTVQDERRGTPDEESYAAGDLRILSRGSANHFISRGIAVEVS
jgi:hypothetical protein